jgi:SAM-dependent methyltransferase
MKITVPLLYHLQHKDYRDDLPFWTDLAEQSQGLILELGCGTGRVLLHLRQQGFRAYGLDLDQEMLSFLRSTLPGPRASGIPAFQAEMTSFNLSGDLTLVILPCNTLSTLTSEQRRQLYRRVFEQLSPSGVFSASLPNPALLADLSEEGEPEEEEFFYLPGGDPVQVSSAWRRDEALFHLRWLYDCLSPDGMVERIEVETIHTLAREEDYRLEIEKAGFLVEAFYGDFDRSPLTPDSPSLIFTARKESHD